MVCHKIGAVVTALLLCAGCDKKTTEPAGETASS